MLIAKLSHHRIKITKKICYQSITNRIMVIIIQLTIQWNDWKSSCHKYWTIENLMNRLLYLISNICHTFANNNRENLNKCWCINHYVLYVLLYLGSKSTRSGWICIFNKRFVSFKKEFIQRILAAPWWCNIWK